MTENNYKLVNVSNEYNELLSITTNIYRVNILKDLIIDDYYDIVNRIIELNKEEDDVDIKMNISIFDSEDPRMNFKTDMLDINKISPDDLFNLVEYGSEDDDGFRIRDYTTIFTVKKVELSEEVF
tara:strand:- start:489 stop:863 length:375 start_codon:yes stop_codon:yes gene_type:complete